MTTDRQFPDDQVPMGPAPIRTTTGTVISGGGPAGMMLGLLLARQGVNVVVLEKHEDFFRDFRGDTVHPRRSGCWTSSALRSRSWSCRTKR